MLSRRSPQNPGASVLRVVLFASALLLITGVGLATAQGLVEVSQRPFDMDSGWNGTYSNGSALFEENCSACHGPSGEGGYGLPLNLQSFLTIADIGYLIRSMEYGRPWRGMPQFTDFLSDEEIRDIALYIKSWQYQPSFDLPNGPLTGDLEEGELLFNGLCTGCHGLGGRGGPEVGGGHVIGAVSGFGGPALTDPGFMKSATDSYIKATLMYGRVGTPMGAYLKGRQGFVELRETEIDSIVVYLRSLEETGESIEEE